MCSCFKDGSNGFLMRNVVACIINLEKISDYEVMYMQGPNKMEDQNNRKKGENHLDVHCYGSLQENSAGLLRRKARLVSRMIDYV